MNVLVTGASGFVGSALINSIKEKRSVRTALISANEIARMPPEIENTVIGSIGPETDWLATLKDIDVVIHLAARVHQMNDTSADPLAQYRHVNLYATEKLAADAVVAGVKRIIFLSTVKVNGGSCGASIPIDESCLADPIDHYSKSKWEAEQALSEISARCGIEVVIIRPTVVYGPGVRANILALFKLANSGLPVPFKGIKAKRSLLGLDNLVSLIELCMDSENAAGEVFLASDGDDVSSSELFAYMRKFLGKPANQFYVSPRILRALLGLLGRASIYDRLWGSFRVSSQKARKLLGWVPPVTLSEGIKKTADWYTANRNSM